MITNKICNHDIHLKFHEIFNHASIESNEMIDKITEKTHDFALLSSKRLYHEITTRINFIRISSR